MVMLVPRPEDVSKQLSHKGLTVSGNARAVKILFIPQIVQKRAVDGPLLYVNCSSELLRRGERGEATHKMPRGSEAVDIVPAD